MYLLVSGKGSGCFFITPPCFLGSSKSSKSLFSVFCMTMYIHSKYVSTEYLPSVY